MNRCAFFINILRTQTAMYYVYFSDNVVPHTATDKVSQVSVRNTNLPEHLKPQIFIRDF